MRSMPPFVPIEAGVEQVDSRVRRVEPRSGALSLVLIDIH